MKLLLVGGGHAHEVALDSLPDSFFTNHQVTLVNDREHALYSGMLPGFLSGKYSFDDVAVNIKEYCQKRGVAFVEGKVTSIDPKNRSAKTSSGFELNYDALSINVGSESRTEKIQIASTRCHSVKPIGEFNDAIQKALSQNMKTLKWIHIGGGAASIEVAIGLKELFRKHGTELTIDIFERGKSILKTHNSKVRRHFQDVLREKNIYVHCGSGVKVIEDRLLTLENGQQFEGDFFGIFTGAKAPDWLSESTLPTKNGFVTIDSTLKVTGQEAIFAAGDCANFIANSVPKAGVFAVRQGEVLSQNFQAHFENKPLKDYVPQKRFLSLIADGPKSATLSYGPLFFTGFLMWKLKDYIDRRFMNRFKDA